MSKTENGSTLEPRQRALAKMKQDVGVWECRWEFLDDNGQIASTAQGVQSMSFIIDDAVMQVMMDVPDMKIQSVTHRFFDPLRQKLFWFSVDNHGDQWSFVEEFDGKPSHSLPHLDAEGTTTHLRFTALRETADEVDILMESSSDKKTWKPIFRQYRVRRVES